MKHNYASLAAQEKPQITWKLFSKTLTITMHANVTYYTIGTFNFGGHKLFTCRYENYFSLKHLNVRTRMIARQLGREQVFLLKE